MKYIVEIEEILRKIIEIEANTPTEAEIKTKQLYRIQKSD